jgi:hypothetical protein
MFKKALILSLVGLSGAVFAQNTSSVASFCDKKDSSELAYGALTAASRFGSFGLVKHMVEKQCVDFNLTKEMNSIGGPFAASTPEIFNYFASKGFDYTNTKKRGATFLMTSLQRDQDRGVNVSEDFYRNVKTAAKQFNFEIDMKEVKPNKDESKLQEMFVRGVPLEHFALRDKEGHGALHYATAFGRGNLAAIIAQRNPDLLTQRNRLGLTPIMMPYKDCDGTRDMEQFYKSVGSGALTKWQKLTSSVSISPAAFLILKGHDDVMKRVLSPKEMETAWSEANNLKNLPDVKWMLDSKQFKSLCSLARN